MTISSQSPYRYFGQLELVELRFPEIRVNFPWRDAFTNKQITKTTIAHEKASVIFLIAATDSSIAASQNRSNSEGLKRAYHYLRTCTGMLMYINESCFHAPFIDLSWEVIKFLIGIILAQGSSRSASRRRNFNCLYPNWNLTWHAHALPSPRR